MHRRQPFDNHYCNRCQCTTRHEVRACETFICQRCGVSKQRVRNLPIASLALPA
ncbi:MAG TPA: hypothetical protein VGP72_22935 [Planctomycetota bacterium]|jgi:hypothetical protein